MQQAYKLGAPMGGDLGSPPNGEAPTFVVHAIKEADGANLDRIQIIKGWIDSAGDEALQSRSPVFPSVSGTHDDIAVFQPLRHRPDAAAYHGRTHFAPASKSKNPIEVARPVHDLHALILRHGHDVGSVPSEGSTEVSRFLAGDPFDLGTAPGDLGENISLRAGLKARQIQVMAGVVGDDIALADQLLQKADFAGVIRTRTHEVLAVHEPDGLRGVLVHHGLDPTIGAGIPSR